MLRSSSFLEYTPNWRVALFLLLLHPPGTLYLLTFDCAKTFSLSNAKKTHLFKQTHLVFLCYIKRLCNFGPKGTIQIRYYYYYYWQACAKRSHAGIVFTHWTKNGFITLQGRHVAPINVKDGMQVHSPVPTFTFIGAKMWEYSPQNCQNFEFWPQICPSGATHLQYFYKILSVCTRL